MHGGGRRTPDIVEYIRSGKPDIIILAEFRGTPPSRKISSCIEEMGLSHQLSSASGKHPAKNALLLASRWPLKRIHWSRPPNPEERRLLAHVRAPKPIAIAAVHVPNRVSGIKYPSWMRFVIWRAAGAVETPCWRVISTPGESERMRA